ncbi:hypothetical protein Tco_0312009 [Tanacetum coccineum]
MFRSTLKLPVETPNHPFIIPTTLKYIQPFLNIVGYQGIVDKVSAFYMNNLAQPWQKMFKRLEEECHSIKYDVPLVSVYTTRNVTVKGMLIPNELLTDNIHETQEYKDYVKEYVGTRITKIAKITEEQENMVAVEKHKLVEDMEKLVEGEDEESYASKFVDSVFLDDKDTVFSLVRSTDAFRKRDHDDHQEDDALPEGEKRAKRQKISKGSKSASDSSSKQQA